MWIMNFLSGHKADGCTVCWHWANLALYSMFFLKKHVTLYEFIVVNSQTTTSAFYKVV